MPLAAGRFLSFYEILGLLGVGGMGEVYRAPDTCLEREVAIKVLPATSPLTNEEIELDDAELERLEKLGYVDDG